MSDVHSSLLANMDTAVTVFFRLGESCFPDPLITLLVSPPLDF